MRSIAFQQWLRSAISDSQQPNSLIGFLFLKLPPPPCVVLLVSIYVALCHIHLRFAWQAWRLVTPTFVLRGRRGTCGTGLALVSHAIFVTYHLSHTFSHTIFDTPSFTHHLCNTHTHKPLSGQVVRNHRVAVCMPQRSTPWCRHSLHDC